MRVNKTTGDCRIPKRDSAPARPSSAAKGSPKIPARVKHDVQSQHFQEQPAPLTPSPRSRIQHNRIHSLPATNHTPTPCIHTPSSSSRSVLASPSPVPSSLSSSPHLLFLLPPSIARPPSNNLHRRRPSTKPTTAMASSPVLALHVVPPKLSLSRPTSPVGSLGTPRSELLLRETLEKDSLRPNSPTPSPSPSALGFFIEPASPRVKPPAPKFKRMQTSPAQLPSSPERGPRSPQQPTRSYTTHSGRPTSAQQALAKAMSIPSPPPNSSTSSRTSPVYPYPYATPPASFKDTDSQAYKRLERTLRRESFNVGGVNENEKLSRSESWKKRRPTSAGSVGQHTSSSATAYPPLYMGSRKNCELTPESRTNSLESAELLTPSSPLPPFHDPHHAHTQLTPPPSPPFNAQTAAKLCASIEGVVRFSDIEGLAAPEMLSSGDESNDEASEREKGEHKRWGWLWWTTGGKEVNSHPNA